jgi:energy-coupling factor transporter ATP-binding protein EcfA2
LISLSADYVSLIETGLPNGNQFTRRDLASNLTAAIKDAQITFVYGNSGTGKSSLVKDVLEAHFPDRWQVWFGPEQAALALSEVQRVSIGVDHPLPKVLVNTSNPKNILVIDSAERFPLEDRVRVKALVRSLLAAAPGDVWRIIIIGQPEAWTDGHLRELASGSQLTKDVEVEELTAGSVIAALRTTESLRWLTSHDDAVTALLR